MVYLTITVHRLKVFDFLFTSAHIRPYTVVVFHETICSEFRFVPEPDIINIPYNLFEK